MMDVQRCNRNKHYESYNPDYYDHVNRKFKQSFCLNLEKINCTKYFLNQSKQIENTDEEKKKCTQEKEMINEQLEKTCYLNEICMGKLYEDFDESEEIKQLFADCLLSTDVKYYKALQTFKD